MVIVHEQTGTGAQDGPMVACSGATLAATTRHNQIVVGGTASATNLTVQVASTTSGAGVFMQSEPGSPNLTSWAAGDWVVRLNVTTANSLVQWDDTYICRVNSSGVNQGTVASLTGQNIGIGATGVQSMTITQGSDEAASATDEIYIVLVFQAAGAHGAQSFAVLFDESVDQPEAAASVRRIFVT